MILPKLKQTMLISISNAANPRRNHIPKEILFSTCDIPKRQASTPSKTENNPLEDWTTFPNTGPKIPKQINSVICDRSQTAAKAQESFCIAKFHRTFLTNGKLHIPNTV